MVQSKAVFCLEVVIYKYLQQPQWICNFYILRIYLSLGIFTAAFVQIYMSFMEIWKKMWVGGFSEHSV